MREQYTAAFAEVFHIRPWEMELLTFPQFMALMGRIDQMNGG